MLSNLQDLVHPCSVHGNCWKRHGVASLEGVSDRQWVSAQIEGTIPDPVGSTFWVSVAPLFASLGRWDLSSSPQPMRLAFLPSSLAWEMVVMVVMGTYGHDPPMIDGYWHLIGILLAFWKAKTKCFLMLEIVGSS